MTRRRIVHLLASHKWTGPADGVVSLCRDLSADHHLRFFCRPDGRRLLADQAVLRGVTPETELRLDPHRPAAIGGDLLRLLRILREEKPEILHLHLSVDHFLGAIAARRAGRFVRVVRTIHHSQTIRHRPLRPWLYESLTDGFITLCESDRLRLKASYRLTGTPVQVIHGAVDVRRFHPDLDARPIRSEFGIGNTTPVIGMVARFQPHRRHDLMLRAMVKINRVLPTARLILVGRGEHQPALERQIEDLGLTRRVHLAGYRDRDLPEVYAAMDATVLLASGSDGSCRAALEAMAVGRPVVGFHVGALPETILEGVTGHLLSEENEEPLAACLVALLTDRPRLRTMNEAARKRVESEFSPSERARKTQAFYEEVIARSDHAREKSACLP